MQEVTRSDVSDGKSWWCPQCKGRKSIREGSFFSRSRLTLQKWFMLLYFCVHDSPVIDVAVQVEVSKGTANDVYQWLHEVCSSALLLTNTVFGGPGKVVEIDESLFCHKPKVRRKLTMYTCCLMPYKKNYFIVVDHQLNSCGSLE